MGGEIPVIHIINSACPILFAVQFSILFSIPILLLADSATAASAAALAFLPSIIDGIDPIDNIETLDTVDAVDAINTSDTIDSTPSFPSAIGHPPPPASAPAPAPPPAPPRIETWLGRLAIEVGHAAPPARACHQI